MPLSTLALVHAVHHASITAMMASDALERVQRIKDEILGVHGDAGALGEAGLHGESAHELARKIARASVTDEEFANVSDFLAADAIAHGPWVMRGENSVGAEYAELLDIEPIVDESWSEDVNDWSLLALLLSARGPGLARPYSGIPAVFKAQQEAIQRIADQYHVMPEDVVRSLV